MANNTKIDLDKQVLSLGESFEALWENINEKFTRKTDNTIPTRTVFVYKTSTSQPGKPIGGSWDNKKNTIVYPQNNPDDLDKEHTWGGADNIERPIWMSVKTFATEPAAETEWSLPTMITQKQSINGLMKTTERATISQILKIIFVKFRRICIFVTIFRTRTIKSCVRLFVKMCMRIPITPLTI